MDPSTGQYPGEGWHLHRLPPIHDLYTGNIQNIHPIQTQPAAVTPNYAHNRALAPALNVVPGPNAATDLNQAFSRYVSECVVGQCAGLHQSYQLKVQEHERRHQHEIGKQNTELRQVKENHKVTVRTLESEHVQAIIDLENKLQTTRDEANALNQKLDILTKQIEDASQFQASAKRRIGRYEQQELDFNCLIEVLTQDKEALEAKGARLEKTIDTLEAGITKLKTDVSSLTEEKGKVATELSQAREAAKKRTNKIATLTSKLAASQKTVDDLRADKSILVDEKEQVSKELSQQKKDAEKQAKKINSLNNQLTEYKGEVTAYEDWVAVLMSGVTNAVQELKDEAIWPSAINETSTMADRSTFFLAHVFLLVSSTKESCHLAAEMAARQRELEDELHDLRPKGPIADASLASVDGLQTLLGHLEAYERIGKGQGAIRSFQQDLPSTVDLNTTASAKDLTDPLSTPPATPKTPATSYPTPPSNDVAQRTPDQHKPEKGSVKPPTTTAGGPAKKPKQDPAQTEQQQKVIPPTHQQQKPSQPTSQQSKTALSTPLRRLGSSAGRSTSSCGVKSKSGASQPLRDFSATMELLRNGSSKERSATSDKGQHGAEQQLKGEKRGAESRINDGRAAKKQKSS